MAGDHSIHRPVPFHRQRCGSFIAYFESSPENSDLPDFLLPEPDRLFGAGETIQTPWHSAATDKVVVNLGNRDVFFKRYNCLGLGYRLKNMFRPSRALKSWRAGWKFLELGVPTPKPLACLEERLFRLLGRSYILFEQIDNATSLLDAWADFDGEQRRDLLQSLGSEIGRMHRLGLIHGDLNWRNIMVQRTPSGPKFYFVDLDGSKFLGKVNRDSAWRDMDHFFRDLQRNGATNDEKNFFIQNWDSCFLFS
jgi:tRNA A-37 threonylcarbamoyl transferase component Bud32